MQPIKSYICLLVALQQVLTSGRDNRGRIAARIALFPILSVLPVHANSNFF